MINENSGILRKHIFANLLQIYFIQYLLVIEFKSAVIPFTTFLLLYSSGKSWMQFGIALFFSLLFQKNVHVTFGYSDESGLWLYPEEAMFLVDTVCFNYINIQLFIFFLLTLVYNHKVIVYSLYNTKMFEARLILIIYSLI